MLIFSRESITWLIEYVIRDKIKCLINRLKRNYNSWQINTFFFLFQLSPSLFVIIFLMNTHKFLYLTFKDRDVRSNLIMAPMRFSVVELCCGRYCVFFFMSYWNYFLFFFCLWLDTLEGLVEINVDSFIKVILNRNSFIFKYVLSSVAVCILSIFNF